VSPRGAGRSEMHLTSGPRGKSRYAHSGRDQGGQPNAFLPVIRERPTRRAAAAAEQAPFVGASGCFGRATWSESGSGFQWRNDTARKNCLILHRPWCAPGSGAGEVSTVTPAPTNRSISISTHAAVVSDGWPGVSEHDHEGGLGGRNSATQRVRQPRSCIRRLSQSGRDARGARPSAVTGHRWAKDPVAGVADSGRHGHGERYGRQRASGSGS
jgi:hypothetical protein